MSGIWTKVWDSVKTTLTNAWTAITSWATHFWDAEVNGVKKVWDGVSRAWAKAWDGIKKVLDIATWVDKNLLQPALKWGQTVMHNLANGLSSAVKDVEHVFEDLGGKIVSNIGKGIQDAAHSVGSHLGSFVQFITDHFPKSPAKRGPLQTLPTFHWIAEQMHKSLPEVQAASARIAAAMPGGSRTLSLSAVGGPGLVGGTSALAGPALSSATQGAAGGLVINNAITIQGGTFTNDQSIRDLAAASAMILKSLVMVLSLCMMVIVVRCGGGPAGARGAGSDLLLFCTS